MSKKVAIVTGGTSGIGRATALALQERGYTVYELSRRAEGMPDIRHIVADITKEETLQAAVEQVLAVEGRLDLVVNNPAPSSSPTRRRLSGCLTPCFSAWCG